MRVLGRLCNLPTVAQKEIELGHELESRQSVSRGRTDILKSTKKTLFLRQLFRALLGLQKN